MTGFAGGWCDIISNIYLVSIPSSLYRAPKSFVIFLGDWYGRITFCSNKTTLGWLLYGPLVFFFKTTIPNSLHLCIRVSECITD